MKKTEDKPSKIIYVKSTKPFLLSDGPTLKFVPKTIVLTAMIADLIHPGHVRLLKRAKALGDYLVVGLVKDRVAASYKRRPVISWAHRAEMLRSIRYVDEVVPMYQKSAVGACRRVNPDVFCRGRDWDDPEAAEWCRQNGKKVVYLPRTMGISSSLIIKKIQNDQHKKVALPVRCRQSAK